MDHTLAHTVTGMTDPTPEEDWALIRRRHDAAERLQRLEEPARDAIRRERQRGRTQVELSWWSGLSILAIRMICRPEVREGHNDRRRKKTPA